MIRTNANDAKQLEMTIDYTMVEKHERGKNGEFGD